jgi:DTW domain-containing protein YfiP
MNLRCSTCRMDQALCLCQDLPWLSSVQMPVHLMFHAKEWSKVTNTGHFVSKILPRSDQCHWNGNDFRLWQDRWTNKSQDRLPILIFPDPQEPELHSGDLMQADSEGLLFLDGTWNQGQQMAKSLLARYPFAVRRLAPPFRASNLWLEPLPDGLATCEAVAWALAVFYPEPRLLPYWQFIRMRSERIEWLRHLRHPQQVFGGLPPAALLARRLLHG